MNIYFACSITGGREHEDVYKTIVDYLLEDGHEVPTAHLAQPEVEHLEKLVDPFDVYERDTNWIKTCDLLVAEVSTPSHGVGYEIGYALSAGKLVLCLHHKALKVSKMITGNRDPKLTVRSYSTSLDAVHILRAFLQTLSH